VFDVGSNAAIALTDFAPRPAAAHKTPVSSRPPKSNSEIPGFSEPPTWVTWYVAAEDDAPFDVVLDRVGSLAQTMLKNTNWGLLEAGARITLRDGTVLHGVCHKAAFHELLAVFAEYPKRHGHLVGRFAAGVLRLSDGKEVPLEELTVGLT
jgi:hypothetical protein